MGATYNLIKAILWSKKDGVSLIGINEALEKSQKWSTKTQEGFMTSTQKRRNWSKQNMLELMNSLAFLKDQK